MAMPFSPLLPAAGRAAATPVRDEPDYWTARRQRSRRRRPLRISKEEEQSILSKALSGLLSGVQYVGETLDKPAAAVRGVASGLTGGEWGGGLLNLIPFSDLAEITDPQERVYGQELLQRWGITPENQPGLNWNAADLAGDVGGFAFEVLTDPLTFVTGPLGSYARGSKLAKAARPGAKAAGAQDLARVAEDLVSGAAGKTPTIASTPATIAQQIRAGERGALGARVPWPLNKLTGEMSTAWTPKSQKARKVAAKAVEKLFYGGGPISKFISAPIRGWRGMFSKSAGGTFAGKTQMAKDFAFAETQRLRDLFTDAAPTLNAARNAVEGEYRRAAEFFEKANDPMAARYFFRALADVQGGVPKGEALLGELAKSMQLDDRFFLNQLGGLDAMADRWHQTVNTLVEAENTLHDRYLQLGGKGGRLEDLYAAHGVGRYPSSYRVGKAAVEGKPVGGTGDVAFWLHRAPEWRNYPKGSEGINEIVRNPLFTATVGRRTGKAAGQLREELLAELKRFYNLPEKASEGAILERLQRGLDELQPYGVTETLGKKPAISTIQRGALWETLVKRHMDEAWPDRNAVKMLGDQEVTYASEIRRFWNANPVTKTTELGRPITTVRDGALDQLLTKVSRLPAEALDRGLFDQSIFEDFGLYMDSMIGQLATMQQTHSLLGRTGAVWREGAKEGGVPLTDVWRDAGFRQNGLATFIQEHPQFVGWQGMDDLGQAMKADPRIAEAMMKQIDEVLPGLRVDESTARALKAMGQVAEPRVRSAIGKLVDQVTAMYKSWLFLPWLASHTRNWGGGFWNAMTDQTVSPWGLIKGHAAAIKHMRTGEGLKDLERMFRLGIFERARLVDVAGEAAEASLGLAQAAPKGFLGGIIEPLRLKNLRTTWKQLTNPTAVRGGPGFVRGMDVPALPVGEYRQVAAEAATAGVKTPAIPMNAWMEAGEQAYKRIEFINRGGYAQALFDAGFSDSQVAYYVKRSQFDYGALSRFEKGTMRRLVPFYGWIRNNIPLQFQKLLERPGGQAAQTYRLFLQGQRPEEGKPPLPRFMREMMGLPVGKEKKGFQTIMRQAGIPLEDLNRFIFEGGIPSTKTIRKFASQLHPIITRPLEWWAGHELWSGRPIKHLASQTEALTKAIPGVEEGVRVPTLDRLISASFGSRAVGEAMQLVHPEKAWWAKALSASTGMRFSTLDVEKWRLLDMKKRVEEIAEASPYVFQGEYQYVPERYAPRATEEKKQLRVARALGQAVQKLNAKRRREGKGAQ